MIWLLIITVLISLGQVNGQFLILENNSSVNVVGELYCQLPMGRKYTSFGGKLKYFLLIRQKLNHTEMFARRQIYIRYVVISIVLITIMLAIEMFFLTQLCSVIRCYFEYLPLIIPFMFAVFPWQCLIISRRFSQFTSPLRW